MTRYAVWKRTKPKSTDKEPVYTKKKIMQVLFLEIWGFIIRPFIYPVGDFAKSKSQLKTRAIALVFEVLFRGVFSIKNHPKSTILQTLNYIPHDIFGILLKNNIYRRMASELRITVRRP